VHRSSRCLWTVLGHGTSEKLATAPKAPSM
jgi:hypothetical protein